MQSRKDKNTVFISYSRRDIELAERIRNDLYKQEFDVLFDKYDISAGEEWQKRLSEMISSANSVLFLISPESIKSHVCSWEIDESERLAKRIFPVILEDTELALIPGRLQRINFTFLNQETSRQQEFDKLVESLKSDLALLREHTRLTQDAHLWNTKSRNSSFLLRGEALSSATRILKSQSQTSLEMSDLLSEFLDASLEQEEKDRNFKRTIIQRSFVQPALKALDDGKFDSALRRIAAGAVLSDDQSLNLEENADHTEKHALWRSAIVAASQPTLVKKIFHGANEHIGNVQLSDDQTKVLGYSNTGELIVWDIESLKVRFAIQPPKENINKAQLLDDNRSLIVAGESGVIRIWDITNQKVIAKFLGHEDQVNTFSLSPDKTLLASGGKSQTNKQYNNIKVWEIRTQKLLAEFPLSHSNWVDNVHFNADASMLISTSCSNILLHDLYDQKSMKLPTFERAIVYLDSALPNSYWHHSIVLSHLIHDTYQLIVLIRHFCLNTKKKAMTFQIWDISSGELLCTNTLRNMSFTSAQMLLDESHLVAPVEREFVGLFEVETGKLRDKIMVKAGFNPTFKQSQCEQFLYIATANRIVHLIDLKSATCIAEYKGHTGPVTDLALSKCGSWFVSSGGSYANASIAHKGESADNTLRIWSSKIPKPKKVFTNSGNAWALCVSECGRFVSAGYPKTGVLTKDLTDGNTYLIETPKKFSGPYAISNNSRYTPMLLSEERPQNVLLCTIDKEPVFIPIEKPKNTTSHALSRGAKMVAFGTQSGNIIIHDVRNKRHQNYNIHKWEIESLDFNRDGTHLISIDTRGCVAIKELAGTNLISIDSGGRVTTKELSGKASFIIDTNLQQKPTVHINNQCNHIIVISKNIIHFYRKKTAKNKQVSWQKVVELTEHVNFLGGPVSVDFHPNGNIAASGSTNIDQVYLWDLRTGAKLSTFTGQKAVYSLAFSPNGLSLYVGSDQGVLQWDVSSFAKFDGNRNAYLSQFLTEGRGKLSFAERQDLLMKNAPPSLLEALNNKGNAATQKK